MLTNIGSIVVRRVLSAARPKRIYKKQFKKKKVVKNIIHGIEQWIKYKKGAKVSTMVMSSMKYRRICIIQTGTKSIGAHVIRFRVLEHEYNRFKLISIFQL